MKCCSIIGISDSHKQWFPPQILELIAEGTVFSGGKRHHDIVKDVLPSDAEWIDITVPLSSVFEKYKEHDEVVVFASGDPLFYGFANTVKRELPDCRITVIPSFNALQLLAHKLLLPYHDMHVVSLTGRPWKRFDEALIRGERLIGVLTDKRNTPEAIVKRMVDYGYVDYSVAVGENLGNEETEYIIPFTPVEDALSSGILSSRQFDINCVMLKGTSCVRRRIAKDTEGTAEGGFYHLPGRPKMITKMPIRLLSLQMLDLWNKESFWDIGFCTGSVSIEAKLQCPHLDVTAFEVRPESEKLMKANTRKFGVPGITAVIGDFLSADLTKYPAADAVFIGGHGGRLIEMIHCVNDVMKPGGCIVFNSVSEDSREHFIKGISEVGMTLVADTLITIDDNNPIHVMKAQ